MSVYWCSPLRVLSASARSFFLFLPYLRTMDKKAQKRIDLLNKKMKDIQQRLAGARKQMDDPTEVRQLEADLAAAKAEVEKLKAT
jgi:predicted  nucleic acid-binding Zn-ribbon protein